MARRLLPLDAAPVHRWPMPGSKSITNRALLLAALADGETELHGVLASDDTRHMLTCLAALGVPEVTTGPDRLRITGGGRRHAPAGPLFVGNSGTTVRFLTALAAVLPGATTLAGDHHMAGRPIGDLVEALTRLGIRVDCPTGCPPVTVHGGTVTGDRVTLRGDRSSQYLSALLMTGPLLPRGLTVTLSTPLVSRPYVALTLAQMADFGVQAAETTDGFTVPAAAYHSPGIYAIEPDASTASYAFAVAAATGGRITVPGIGAGTRQGDHGFIQVLAAMGCSVQVGPDSTTVAGPSRLHGIKADLHHLSDTVPTLAALAPLCDGPVTIRNVANIRLKETDRLAALTSELRRLGQEVREFPDGLRIEPRPLVPATVHCHDDHRLAMAFAVLGLARPGITIDDPDCVAKTHPGFWDDLAALAAAAGGAPPWQDWGTPSTGAEP